MPQEAQPCQIRFQPGTKRLVTQYGACLVRVSYRYDAEQRKRFKTVELIVGIHIRRPGGSAEFFQDMQTNRDLYSFVADLCEGRSKNEVPSLEVYLRSLWSLARTWEDDIIPLDKIGEWFRAAFSTPAPAFDDAWRSITFRAEEPARSRREAWEQFILFQIADLRRMAEIGSLDSEYRYFGIDSPTGVRWYNFDPCTYLECGVRGSLGGYKEEEVIVLVRPEDGGSADSPVVPVESLTWDEFKDLLWCGMTYE